MMAGIAVGLGGSLLLATAIPDRRRLWFCVAGVVGACIPTHHMLLIGPSMEQSRYLTYAAPAFILLLLTAGRGMPRQAGVWALALITVFQAAALETDLRIWSSVAQERYRLADRLAVLARSVPGVVSIRGLPVTLDGVYWRNGLEDCLNLDFGIPMGRVRVNEPEDSGATLQLRWDSMARSVR